MKFTHCLFIDRRTTDGRTDFTDLPFNDLDQLMGMVDPALSIPYVTGVRITEKTSEIEGKPWWGATMLQREASDVGVDVSGFYSTEEQFKQDLRKALNDDHLFERIYQAKEEYQRLLAS